MAKFIYVYHGGTAPKDPAEVEKVMAAWNAWYGGMGDKLLDGGGPVGMSSTVTSSGIAEDGGANPVSGFTIVEADDKAAANKLAGGCPILADGGSVEVAEVIAM
ncbi:MAG: hypothetical protein AAF362_04620 [Pseudomonadota bacterium]